MYETGYLLSVWTTNYGRINLPIPSNWSGIRRCILDSANQVDGQKIFMYGINGWRGKQGG